MAQALGCAKYAFIDTPSDFTRWFLIPKGVKNCTLRSVLDRVKSATAVVFLTDIFLSPMSPALREIISGLKTFGNVTKVALVVPSVVDAVSEVQAEPDIHNLNDEPFANRPLAITKRVIAVADALFGGVETVCTFLTPFQVPVLGAVLNVATVLNSGITLVTSGISMVEDARSWYNLSAAEIVPVLPAEIDEATRARDAHVRALTVLEKVYSTAGKVLGVAAAIMGIIGTVALFVASAPAIPFYVVPVCLAGMSIFNLFSKYVKESKENLLAAPQLHANPVNGGVPTVPAAVDPAAGSGLVVEEVNGFPEGVDHTVEGAQGGASDVGGEGDGGLPVTDEAAPLVPPLPLPGIHSTPPRAPLNEKNATGAVDGDEVLGLSSEALPARSDASPGAEVPGANAVDIEVA